MVKKDGAGKESILERAARKIDPVGPPPDRRADAASADAGASQDARSGSRRTSLADIDIPDDFKPHSRPQEKRSRVASMDLERLKTKGFITPDVTATTTAEELRLIKRTLILNAFAKGEHAIRNGNMILVTSCRPGEGKTFCAINLALSIALEQDVTVLLVDADFSKPEILSYLGLPGGKGLVDVVADPTIDLADCLIRTNLDNFAVLPAGRQHNLTPELLASDRMGRMTDDIARRYSDRIVIFDSPPVLASSAASVIALHVGQVAFVVEAESTTEPQVREGLNLLSACETINLILNKTRYTSEEMRFGTYYGYSAS